MWKWVRVILKNESKFILKLDDLPTQSATSIVFWPECFLSFLCINSIPPDMGIITEIMSTKVLTGADLSRVNWVARKI